VEQLIRNDSILPPDMPVHQIQVCVRRSGRLQIIEWTVFEVIVVQSDEAVRRAQDRGFQGMYSSVPDDFD